MNEQNSKQVSEDVILNALRAVKDPDLHKDIVALNMIRDVKICGGVVSFRFVLTTPACPVRDQLKFEAERTVMAVPGVERVEVKMEAEVPKARGVVDKADIAGIKHIIAVSSGKGGVGKSTVAVNLAVSLGLMGAKVGILDTDVYGPNVPIMMGGKDMPAVRGEMIVPPVYHGVKTMSIGLLNPGDKAVVWRGPMLHSAVSQFLRQVEWGELDYLIVDMPPGCLTADTLVFTSKGPIPISKIEEGMEVYSFDGHLNKVGHKSHLEMHASLIKRKVLAVIPQGKTEVYELKTPTRSIKGTEDHPLLAIRRSKRRSSRFYDCALEWVKLGALKPGDIILTVKKLPEEDSAPFGLPELIAPGARDIRLPSTGRFATQTFWGFGANMRAKTDLYGAGLIRGTVGQGLRHEYIGFERVKEVRPIGVDEVYDLHVEGEHNFVANGLIVHNTGDVQLSLAQLVPVAGAVLVTTPQEVALSDVRKAYNMFDQLHVPILGVVENMSYFECPNDGAKFFIFGNGGGEALAEAHGAPFLGAIPIAISIREGGDLGVPIVISQPDSSQAKAFQAVAQNVAAQVSIEALKAGKTLPVLNLRK